MQKQLEVFDKFPFPVFCLQNSEKAKFGQLIIDANQWRTATHLHLDELILSLCTECLGLSFVIVNS